MKQILIVASAALSDRHNSLLHSAGIHFPDQISMEKVWAQGDISGPENVRHAVKHLQCRCKIPRSGNWELGDAP